MGGAIHDSLYGLLFVAVVAATFLAAAVLLAPTVGPEPFAGAVPDGVWIVATASLTILGMLLVLLVLRLYV